MIEGGLRPLGFGELLDAAFKLYGRRWRELLKAVAVVAIPMAVLRALIQLSTSTTSSVTTFPGFGFGSTTSASSSAAAPTAAELAASLGGSVALIVLSVVTASLAMAAALRIVAGVYLGDESGWKDSLRFAWSRFWGLLGVAVLTFFATIVGLLVLCVGAIVAMTMFSVAVPVLLLEGMGASDAMKRSWRLVAPRFWNVLGLLFVGAILVGVVSAPVSGIFIGVLVGSNGNVFVVAVVSALVSARPSRS